MADWERVVIARYGRQWRHPLFRYQDFVAALVRPGEVVVDAGCGHDMPLRAHLSSGVRYVGLDRTGGVRCDLERIPLPSGCADWVTSKSVMEHLRHPEKVFAEIGRILKPRGTAVVLTPNLWDVTSLAALLIPNSLHPRVVRFGEGRAEEDTFPTYYRANTERGLRRLCARSGLRVERLEYWGQYPSMLHRWPALLSLGCRFTRLLDQYESLRKLRGWIFLVARRQPVADNGAGGKR